jgi:hypothetical protein
MAGETDHSAQYAWIARVLGVASGPTSVSRDGGPLLPIWIEAKDTVGEQITKLQTVMRGTDFPLLRRIADAGLNGITGRLQVGLMVELTEFDRAATDARPQSATRLRGAINRLRGFLDQDRAVPLLDSNPLGVTVAIRRELGGALDRIERALPS